MEEFGLTWSKEGDCLHQTTPRGGADETWICMDSFGKGAQASEDRKWR